MPNTPVDLLPSQCILESTCCKACCVLCSAGMFMSGSDDGTVRHYDTRDPASTTTIPGMRTGEMVGKAYHALRHMQLASKSCSVAELTHAPLSRLCLISSLSSICYVLLFVFVHFPIRRCCCHILRCKAFCPSCSPTAAWCMQLTSGMSVLCEAEQRSAYTQWRLTP